MHATTCPIIKIKIHPRPGEGFVDRVFSLGPAPGSVHLAELLPRGNACVTDEHGGMSLIPPSKFQILEQY